jgi:hypothetical protein
MELTEDLRQVADAAIRFAEPDGELTGIVPAEPSPGERMYLCAYAGDTGRAWLVIGERGRVVDTRADVRAVVSIAALCELAEEVAGGGDLDDLRSRLVSLHLTENPPGIAEAEEALAALQATIGGPPRIATPEHLDAVGAATVRLEQALGNTGESPFAAAMKQAAATADELARDVEAGYKLPLT